MGGRGAGHDLEAVAQISKPPARKPVPAPRAVPTIPTARGRDIAPVAGKLAEPASTQAGRRPAASSALARAAASSVSSAASRGVKQKPAATFRATGVRAPPLKPLRSGPVYHTFERMAPSARIMTPLPRVTAYSISSSIHLGTLLGFLRREHGVKPRLYDECAYAVYTKPLLPGFGRANVRSAPEPRSASPGAESRRERELEEREEFGYVGTYFEHRSEEDEDIDPDGYIKGGEGRGSESESRHGHRRRDSDDRDGRREGGETSAWESEAEQNHWSREADRNGQRRDSGGIVESETDNEQGRNNGRHHNLHRHGQGDLMDASDPQQHHQHQQHALASRSLDEEDEAMLATPLARPVAVKPRGEGSDLEDGESRPFLLERARSSSQSSSDMGDYSRSWRDDKQRRSNSSDLTAVEGEVTDPDTAGARDMLMQQLSEEIDGPNAIASSYRSTDTVLSAEMTSEAEEGANLLHELDQIVRRRRPAGDGSLHGDRLLDSTAESEARKVDELVPLPPVLPGRLSPSRHSASQDNLAHAHEGGQRIASPGPERPHKKSKGRRKHRKRTKFTGPNMASHNHDTSANLLTPRPILEALQSAELIILPYGVLVMYNFTAAEERSIIDVAASPNLVPFRKKKVQFERAC
ncbi:Sad1-interacting factor 3 [Thecaphora frezii]